MIPLCIIAKEFYAVKELHFTFSFASIIQVPAQVLAETA